MPPPAPAPAAATTQPASNSAAGLAAAKDRVVYDRRMRRKPPKAASRLSHRILREYTWPSDPPATVPQGGACYPDHRFWGPEPQSLDHGTDTRVGSPVVRGEARGRRRGAFAQRCMVSGLEQWR